MCVCVSMYSQTSKPLGNKPLGTVKRKKGMAVLERDLQSCQSTSVWQWEISLAKRKSSERFKDPIEIHTANCHSPQRPLKLRQWVNTGLPNWASADSLGTTLHVLATSAVSCWACGTHRGLGRGKQKIFSDPCDLPMGLQAKMFPQSDSLCAPKEKKNWFQIHFKI